MPFSDYVKQITENEMITIALILSAVAVFLCGVMLTVWRYVLTMVRQAFREISELNKMLGRSDNE